MEQDEQRYKQIQVKRHIWLRLLRVAAAETLRRGQSVSSGTVIDEMLDVQYPHIPAEVTTCQQ